jgi:hypothetical protein
MRKLPCVLLSVVLALSVAGCAKRAPEEGRAQGGERAATPPPASSPLAKVQTGMSQREVQNLIGPPSDEKQYITGKAFIPWYFGPDRSRSAYYYKGQGRVVFAGGSVGNMTGKVVRVEYDPNESGHAR